MKNESEKPQIHVRLALKVQYKKKLDPIELWKPVTFSVSESAAFSRQGVFHDYFATIPAFQGITYFLRTEN